MRISQPDVRPARWFEKITSAGCRGEQFTALSCGDQTTGSRVRAGISAEAPGDDDPLH
ncbi:hypothetical protein C731_3449 [Mycolicibacterium hassiacum DSM 44199]|uniref:Uncharacterized protein n=1 Tax=Mycolicibacterium hassiacum (strain DSM 44199 / CIP 105218 / JCM 12690 / 3849) TaxID=1122247 RepID=K5BEY8_MYCHD|nr:hypothetical protein C731_3449 [Mycolicibacterium hassiacum DSM 44199]